ncbi:MAG: hypothetical protein KC616_02490 [Myxococcales bacterium]|nr:hypothetical protein [Myxococcales bacterium]
MKKSRSILRALLPPLMSLLLFAGLFELGVLLVAGEQAKFPRHVVGTDFGVRVNQPDTTYRHKSADGTWWFTINSRGLRADREYPYEKPPGVFRIVSLGDSFTAGYEVAGDETFSSVLEQELRRAGLQVEVLNAGVSGYSNAEALLYLERELLKYDPDLVLLSFFANDLVDNVRSGLFRLEEGRLVQTADGYVPAGAIGNFLNTNPLFNWLSGYSNAFVFAKERLTHILKRRIVEQNRQNVADAVDGAEAAGATAPPEQDEADGDAGDSGSPEQALAVAILDRLYEQTHARGIPLVIQSIPIPIGEDEGELVETFPVDYFDLDREGLYFVGMAGPLTPWVGREPLYNRRSHGHWTAFAHRVSGETLARLVLREHLLDRSMTAAAVAGHALPSRSAAQQPQGEIR